ncbi:MAG: TetR/AcrR family transcriptional regulator [Clostridia bacterium]|nr:TetR/AcrR family transcriptional regulator [Clostridia bacterium]
MSEKEDLRVRRTKTLLSNAFIELMQTVPYNKICINDICDAAMVHRATFYNHFYDKDNLFNYILTSISEELYEKAKSNKEFNTSKEMYLSLISCAIDFLVNNRNKIQCIIKNSSEKLFNIVIDTLKRSVLYYSGKIKNEEKYVIPKEILIDFFIGGLSFLGFNLIEENNFKYNKEELMRYCDVLLNEKSFLI